MAAHLAGRLQEAEKIYLDALTARSGEKAENVVESAQIWHLLAAVRHQMGNVTEAQQNALRAVELNPDFPEAMNTLGSIQKDLGLLAEAAGSFQQAIEIYPDFPQALTNLADVRRLEGANDEAILLNERALQLAPDLAPAHNNLGAAKLAAGDVADAGLAFQQALALDASLDDARLNLADCLRRTAEFKEAEDLVMDVIERQPSNAVALNQLGTIYFDNGNDDGAMTYFEKALAADVDLADAYNNLGNVLVRLNRLPEALDRFDAALSKRPDFSDALANQAAAFQALGRIEEALSACEHALKHDPDHADAHWNRGLARLISGDLSGGFADYEWRWRLPEFIFRYPDRALWQGEDLSGKSLLVHSEQGFGDTIQMARYLSLLAAKGAHLIVETHQPLVDLIKQLDVADEVGTVDDGMPETDFQVPMMSLPHRFGTTVDTIPQPAAFRIDEPANGFDFGIHSGLKIGLVWAGRSTHKNDHNRSIPVAMFEKLTELEGVSLFSLQVGDRAGDLAALTWRDEITDLSHYLTDFNQTAQAIAGLDLVVTIDTAVAHLAGSMGKDCWVLLPFAPDWRWFQDRTDSPWYNSVTLFRQMSAPDGISSTSSWKSVIEKVTAELAARRNHQGDHG